MRQHKYRAWDKKRKIMSKVGRFEILEPRALIAEIKNGGHQISMSDIILLEFTGLKDKNGVEIYEGDVLKWTLPAGFINPLLQEELYNDTTTISQVIFVDGNYELHGIEEDEGWKTLLNGEIPRNEYGEVLGSIHANPKLLGD